MDQTNQQGRKWGSAIGSRRNRGQNAATMRSSQNGPTTSSMSTTSMHPPVQQAQGQAQAQAHAQAQQRQRQQALHVHVHVHDSTTITSENAATMGSDLPNTAQHAYMSQHQGGPSSTSTPSSANNQSAMDYAMASAEQFSRGAQHQHQPQHHTQQPQQPQHHRNYQQQQQQQQQGGSQSASRIPVPMHDQVAYPYGARHIHDRPIVKLSVSLIDTYKNINRVYYEEKEARAKAKASESSGARRDGSLKGVHNNGWDDENYDYIINEGDLFLDRYEIKTKIGKGSFGQVVKAFDRETHKEVAIKIIKSKKPFLMQAKTEIELLTRICEADHRDQYNIIRLISHFMYRNHQCLVFELLSLNLYEVLKNKQFEGLSLVLIRKFAKQILRSLSFLARPDIDIIHCDLKPENILLSNHRQSKVKVIDFGSSCRSNKRMYSYIQSRFYRSPEVMLGLPYSVAIDMWSLGCILVEMHTGEPLFSGTDQVDQMQKIVKVLGMPPVEMIEKSSDQNRLQFFRRNNDSMWVSKSDVGINASRTSTQNTAHQSLTEVITAERSKKNKSGDPNHSPQLYAQFVDLIQKMFIYEPAARITPDEALMHPFITEGSASSHPAKRGNDSLNHRGDEGDSNQGGSIDHPSLSRISTTRRPSGQRQTRSKAAKSK
mmetsp:Transcript_7946/g.11823  ORF Transcript_7946/g.11823 Transcript_7946/m.11823 type:complete len:657 (-) Transcript_7946:66-2036(-)